MFTNYYCPEELSFGWRVYVFDHAYEAEEFSDLWNGIARAGRDHNGKWLAFI